MNSDKYADIINMPHHISERHSQMSREARSAQFAPFAALTGYNDAVKETARLTDERIEIDEGLKLQLNSKLQKIIENIKTTPEITVTYFVYDIKKEGGKYITVKGNVRKIDIDNECIILSDKTKIPINEIINITSTILK